MASVPPCVTHLHMGHPFMGFSDLLWQVLPWDKVESRCRAKENTSGHRELFSPPPCYCASFKKYTWSVNRLFFLWQASNAWQKNVSLQEFPHHPASTPVLIEFTHTSSTLYIIRYFFEPFLFLLSPSYFSSRAEIVELLLNIISGWKIGRKVDFHSSWAKSFNLQNLPSHSNQLENTFIFCFDHQLILILPVCWLSSD